MRTARGMLTVAWLAAATGLLALPGSAGAEDGPPQPRTGDWVAHGFRFHDGTVFPELRLHYITLGNPANPAVVIIHGTAQTGTSMLTPSFAGELFGPGQPLDATKYFIVLPDTIGTGGSSKPSDGLHGHFPAYNYDDMVQAEYRLVTEGLGLRHLRLVLGNSMGGMHVWLWGTTYPGFADALVPLASQPTPMAGRNWILRRLLVESIRRDPDYHNGDYTTQPTSVRLASILFADATSGGTLAYAALAPTAAQGDALVDKQLSSPAPADANDYLFQWDASRDYDPSPQLDRITAPVLAINSADDERNPPETGLEAAAIARLPHGELFLIPASADTRGHATTAMARFWKQRLASFLASLPPSGT